MASLLSDAPGRLRLRLDAQETRPARLIQEQLAALPGVQEVRLTPRIGSLAIIYDPDAVSRDALLGILAAGGVALVSAEPAVRIEYTGVTPASPLPTSPPPTRPSCA